MIPPRALYSILASTRKKPIRLAAIDQLSVRAVIHVACVFASSADAPRD
jgi:hypothetical protein